MREFLSRLARWQSAPRLRAKDASSLFKRLSFLISSGMPLVGALEMLALQSERRGVADAVRRAAAEIAAGRSLADALGRFPGLASPFALGAIRAAEASGTLADNLRTLADDLARSHALRSKIRGSLLYPLVIFAVASALIVALTAFVLPKILPLFSGLGVSLPRSTRALLSISSFMRHWGLWTALVIGLAAVAIAQLLKRYPRLAAARDRLLLRLPIAGALLRDGEVAALARMLGALLRSGMPLGTALEAASGTARNAVFQNELRRMRIAVERGGSMGTHMATSGAFPPLVGHLVSVGEASGSLPETLDALAAQYEQETEERARTLSSLVEPAVMLLMGLSIGFVAVSIIAPIYQITGHINAH